MISVWVLNTADVIIFPNLQLNEGELGKLLPVTITSVPPAADPDIGASDRGKREAWNWNGMASASKSASNTPLFDKLISDSPIPTLGETQTTALEEMYFPFTFTLALLLPLNWHDKESKGRKLLPTMVTDVPPDSGPV